MVFPSGLSDVLCAVSFAPEKMWSNNKNLPKTDEPIFTVELIPLEKESKPKHIAQF